MELRCEPGPDGPEVWACADGVAFARAVHYEGDGYWYVNRDLTPPELEAAVQELEYEAGERDLQVGESVSIDVRRPTDLQVDAARRGDPPHRPGPRAYDPTRLVAQVGNLIVTATKPVA